MTNVFLKDRDSTMKKLRALRISALLLLGIGATTAAEAVTVDFRDAQWAVAANTTNQLTQTVGGIQVSVSSNPISTTFLHYDSDDGFGVTGPLDSGAFNDEVEFHDGDSTAEIIKIDFASAVNVLSFTVSDFFPTTGINSGTEEGIVSFDNGNSFSSFTSSNFDANGEQNILLGALGVNSIILRAGNIGSDFAIQSLEVSAVPIPSAFLLFGSGLIFLLRKKTIG